MRPDERPATVIFCTLASVGFGLIALGAWLGTAEARAER